MFKVHCHVHESAVLLDWSRVERMYDSDAGPVIDWHCWCGARGRLIAGARSEPRVIEPVVVDLARTPTPVGVDRSGPDGVTSTRSRPEAVLGQRTECTRR